jgi:hypothetical protein
MNLLQPGDLRLLGLEPIFEGGWLHKGRRGERWDVEDKLVVIALFGDVTVDLTHTNSAPDTIDIEAWAIFRDVDVTVPSGTHVELTGGGLRGHLRNEATALPEDQRQRVVRVHGHTLVCDVTVRVAQL